MRVEPSHMGSVPYRRGSREILSPLTMWGHSEKVPAMGQEEGLHENMTVQALGLGLPASRTDRNKFLLLINYPTCGILL